LDKYVHLLYFVVYLWIKGRGGYVINFETELHNLLTRESEPISKNELTKLTELAAAGQQLLVTLNKRQTDMSAQIEEIYDLTKETDTRVLQTVLQAEKNRADQLAVTVMSLSDIIEDFCVYARQSGSEELEHQALMMRKNAGNLLESCGITNVGEEGQLLDPEIHAVHSAVVSPIPREHVARVLQSGYRYLGALTRKAAVVVSVGMEETKGEQNYWN
jgi:molecular chaperone GrpE (heat shock protein)